ncbi:branched-chain amino acid transport system II carrier protein [Lagierella sp.]|uniref:branched-chain amino acid transport system II carrier protein n=1 Tax=Lagierella sp. TaxID=2849657 RepID=UPI00262C41F6|nr:branched-chain amino acid transport system II carrier protein [Lagierella sp.]
MKKSSKNYLVIGSMLFGLFFGAGNLIFPVFMGQLAGGNYVPSLIGFLITAVGMPFLGVLAVGYSKSEDLLDMTKKISKGFGYFFTIALYLTIGPFFALPRLSTTSFEVGLSSNISGDNHGIILLAFTFVFYLVALLLALKPNKIMTYIGKVLNPIFLVVLSILLIFAFFRPMGNPSVQAVTDLYSIAPFSKGFVEGYNTMDVLAALAFSVIVINAIRSLGIDQPKEIVKYTIKSGVVTIVLMSIIYSALIFMGASSLGVMAPSENGGLALAEIAKYFMGTSGQLLLAVIVTVACLKTATGLITACSEVFNKIFPKVSYLAFAIIIALISFIISNVGLTQIINLSLPVLVFLYPLAIVIIILVLISPLFDWDMSVYRITLLFTGVTAVFDAFSVLPEALKNTRFIEDALSFALRYIPLFSISFGWIVPTAIGLVFALFVRFLKKKNLHLLRRFALFLQIVATIFLFQGIYKYFKKEAFSFFPVFGFIVFILSILFRYLILKDNFYVQQRQKSRPAQILSRFGTVLGFAALYFLPNDGFVNSIVGGILFNLGVLLNDRYLKYYTQVEYNRYMKNR